MSSILGSVTQDPLCIPGEHNQIWVCCDAKKATRNRLSLVVACWLPIACGILTCSNVYLPYTVQVKSFIRNLEAFSKPTTGLAVVLLCDCLQVLVVRDL